MSIALMLCRSHAVEGGGKRKVSMKQVQLTRKKWANLWVVLICKCEGHLTWDAKADIYLAGNQKLLKSHTHGPSHLEKQMPNLWVVLIFKCPSVTFKLDGKADICLASNKKPVTCMDHLSHLLLRDFNFNPKRLGPSFSRQMTSPDLFSTFVISKGKC